MARVLLDLGVSRKWHSIYLTLCIHTKLTVGLVRSPRPSSTLPLLSYDLFVNVVSPIDLMRSLFPNSVQLLTSMFIWPLRRDRHTNQRLRLLAWRTLAYVVHPISHFHLRLHPSDRMIDMFLHVCILQCGCSCSHDVLGKHILTMPLTLTALRLLIYGLLRSTLLS